MPAWGQAQLVMKYDIPHGNVNWAPCTESFAAVTFEELPYSTLKIQEGQLDRVNVNCSLRFLSREKVVRIWRAAYICHFFYVMVQITIQQASRFGTWSRFLPMVLLPLFIHSTIH